MDLLGILRIKDSNGNWVSVPGLKGDTGEPFKILGIYATAADLEADVEDPGVGDVYLVGTVGAYDIYLYLTDGWHNTGRYMPKGDQGDPAPAASITSAVETWLAANVDPETGYVLDRTLSQSNAAAPADLVGDLNKFLTVTNDYNKLNHLLINPNGWVRGTSGATATDWSPANASTTRLSSNYIPSSQIKTPKLKAIPAEGYKTYVYFVENNTGAFPYYSSGWQTEEFEVNSILSESDYIVLLIAKEDDSTITIDEARNVLFVCSYDEPSIDNNQDKILYQGKYAQGGYSAAAASESAQRIHMEDCVALPYGDKTIIHVEFNTNYLFAVRAGKTAQNLSSNKYWYNSGDNVEFTDGEQYYRIIWAKGKKGPPPSYKNLTPEDITDIAPTITYSHKKEWFPNNENSNSKNFEILTNVQNIISAISHGGIGSMPVVFHGSDFHGDYERVKNALKMSEYCDSDAIVFSGDMVSFRRTDGAAWLHSLLSDYNGKPILCTGNHEANGTDAEVYAYYMEESASKIGNTNEKTYYYTDIANKSLRIISVDMYQYGGTTRSNAHMTDEQLAYICNALATTPSGYGVLMVEHTPCVDLGSLKDPDYATFFQDLRKYGFTHYDISGTPIYDIVDAFISRTTISETYTQTGSPSTLTVSADFSEVPTSVEFIAHLTGHIHEDSVCYLPTNNKQLMLNVCCGVAMRGGSSYPYLADDCDITKIPYGKTQDTLNAYVIDRANKVVKIVRIGGTVTYDMKDREYMAIPYAD